MSAKLYTLLFSMIIFVVGCGADNKDSQLSSNSEGIVSLKAALDQDIENIAQSLDVKYQHIDNRPSEHCNQNVEHGNCFRVDLVFTAKQAINVNQWNIYFSQITPIQTSVSNEFTVSHINGDLHKISLTEKFNGFAKGESKIITFYATFWSLSETDALPNYIVSNTQGFAQVIESTKVRTDPDTGLEILPYVVEYKDAEKQFKRTQSDKTAWLTAEKLFERNLKHDFSTTDLSQISIQQQLIPTPSLAEFDESGKTIDIKSGLNIHYNNVNAVSVKAAIERLSHLGISTVKGNSATNVTLKIIGDETTKLGAYELIISESGIEITAGDNSGIFYGLQSIAGLYQLNTTTLPIVKITDEPHYEFRGLLVDVARNFRNKTFMLKLLEQMSAYKLNKLHLHLGDDEGWRLEIPSLPELTEISSKRCFDLKEQNCLLPQLGAGIDPNTAVNGYYSVADYQEILQAASARHIQIIPSLDMPGHSRAAVKAMTARYNKYMQLENEEKAKQFLLHDPQDTTKYSSVQYYNDNTINVCLESSYAFVSEVMQQVKMIHQNAGQPLTRYHIGADETAGAWVESPACKTFLNTNTAGITKVSQLGGYFVERVAGLLASMNIETAAWSDGLSHTRRNKMPAIVQANAWSLLMWNGHRSAHELANRNWHVVVSTPDVLYFDFPYEADPKEHGYYWASRHINTEKIFQFMPDNLPIHAEFWLDREDKSYIANDTLQVDNNGIIISQPLEKGRSFAGVQGQLWSENTRTDATAEYKIFPRLMSLAQKGWHKSSWSVPYDHNGFIYSQDTKRFTSDMKAQRNAQWRLFSATLGMKEFAKLEQANVHYRLPTVGAKIVKNMLLANIAYPGLTIEYKVEEGKWTPYAEPTKVSGDVWVRAKSINGDRYGRKLKVQASK